MESVNFTSTMLPFFSLAASTKKERIAMLKKAFIFVAGDDLAMFDKHFLTATEFGKHNFLPLTKNTKADEFIGNLKELMQNPPSKHLIALRYLVTSSYSLSELINIGFKITKNEYKYSKKLKCKKNKTRENLSIKNKRKK